VDHFCDCLEGWWYEHTEHTLRTLHLVVVDIITAHCTSPFKSVVNVVTKFWKTSHLVDLTYALHRDYSIIRFIYTITVRNIRNDRKCRISSYVGLQVF
jgi:hypothetical protein